MKKFDTTNHTPYARVTRVEIDYSQDGKPHVEYIERKAVVDGNGNVQHIGAEMVRHDIDFSLLPDVFQVVDPATCEKLDGQTVTVHDVMLGMLAILRADQVLRSGWVDGEAVEDDEIEAEDGSGAVVEFGKSGENK
ncbi:MAG: hypothetical protein ACRC0J_23125 [Shewanella oncorhynchi]